ncbi:peptide chain release factor N(5)-glutamine methyltransferase [Caenimonas sedimenti]|uniref:Release factor glutamine methyltransferase n=1 Tax=Caenimonas sedimenti TaxID=2596921 RepID=A0A562ZKN6_9BURK|nr:peptide chain release factor N(5)-glutamine methyltransferase [Caenimonas sedimenti]TWO68878.1 peptide chain release factor N(5)-glutamine methyltransferase [Caenimonas sedimenti]
MNTLREGLAQAVATGVARLDAQLLLLHVLGRPAADRGWVIAHDGDPLPDDAHRAFLALAARRAAGEPLAYLVGQKEFFGLTLAVDARVLVPRPETEHLVEWSLEVLEGKAQPTIVDLGTGSGAIALALASRRPDARIEAVDASMGALETAAANARALGLAVAFRQADWLAGAQGPYDLIVSNPPYVASADPHLAALKHEPLSALASGADGLDALRAIAGQAPALLRPRGWLLLEHGHDQAPAVRALLEAAGLSQIQSRNDLAGIPRCTGGLRLELG